MYLVRKLEHIPKFALNSVLTIGNFDGLHLGHQKIIESVVRIAAKIEAKPAIMFFEPHPLSMLQKKNNLRLSSFQDKIKILISLGIEIAFIPRFDQRFADQSATEFAQLLFNSLQVKHLVIGYDFVFGKGRTGNIDLLENMAKKNHSSLTVIKAQSLEDGQIIYSSSLVREMLAKGEMEKVKIMLGRNFQITARIVKGRSIASQIGFKTANILWSDLTKIKFGVYLVKVTFADRIFPAIANFGIKPSFDLDQEPILEIHILNFSEEIYGKKISIEFLSMIRAEQKFPDISSLKIQIAADIEKAKKYFL